MNIERICYKCGSKMHEENRELEIEKDSYKVKLSGIKGYVCDSCGEVVYPFKDIQLMENLCNAMKESNNCNEVDFMDVSEIAETLKVSNQTIYNMIRDKRLKPVKIGRKWRFMKKDIESILSVEDDLDIAARGLNGSISDKDLDIIKKYIDGDTK